MHKLLIVVFLVGACAEGNMCQVSVAGMCVRSDNEIFPAELERAVEVMIEEVNKKDHEVSFDKFIQKLSDVGATVRFLEGEMSLDCHHVDRSVYICDKHIGGVIYGGEEVFIKHNPCLGFTSFVHELLHAIEFFYIPDSKVGTKDYAHETPGFFIIGPEDFRETVEYKSRQRLICELDSCLEMAETTNWCE